MTADGTDDNLIKLEGVPKGENFTFMDDVPAAGGETIAEAGAEPEPEDVAPRREEADGNEDGLQLDDEDDADEDDAPPAPCEPPAGFAFAAAPPTEEALTFSKQPVAEAEALVGRSIMYNWPGIGWYADVLQRRVIDGRIKRSSKNCNFYIYYEVDDDEVPSALSLDEYGSEDEGGWLLLDALAATV